MNTNQLFKHYFLSFIFLLVFFHNSFGQENKTTEEDNKGSFFFKESEQVSESDKNKKQDEKAIVITKKKDIETDINNKVFNLSLKNKRGKIVPKEVTFSINLPRMKYLNLSKKSDVKTKIGFTIKK